MPTLMALTHIKFSKGLLKMEMPTVVNELNDPANGVTYRVMAYRPLSKQELMQSAALYLRQKKGKKPKRGSLVTIISIIGADGM